jgi:deoxyribonuclease V
MDLARPEFAPEPGRSNEEMANRQREIANIAVFNDDHDVDPQSIALADSISDSVPIDSGAADSTDKPLVAGVDQAFTDEKAISVIVVIQGTEVIERVTATEPIEIPYIPGLLAFREGGAVLAAFDKLTCEPDIALLDGSGRIHYREAGLATHVGVVTGVPTIGVAKNLLCGEPQRSLDGGLAAGARVPIEADNEVTTVETGTTIGYAVQTRQYDSPNRHINPLIVSPGHRVSATTAAEVVTATAPTYKLPDPTRLADSYADTATSDG